MSHFRAFKQFLCKDLFSQCRLGARRMLTSDSCIDTTKIKSMREVIETLSKNLASAEAYQDLNKKVLMDILPKSQSELPNRSFEDSSMQALIPLSSNKRLKEKYITFLGGIRVGRLLEDLDAFAVSIVYKYIQNPLEKADLPSPYTVVTGMVDRLDFAKDFDAVRADTDILLEGSVTWVGTSSMEVTIVVKQKTDDMWRQMTRAVFVMVARDPLNQGPASVNPVVCETEEEKRIFKEGEINKLARKLIKSESLFNSPPNETEKELIHDVFLKMADPHNLSYVPKFIPPNSKWMADSKLKNLILCHPEHRNRSNKIFGGFLMRQAIELSWACALVYSSKRPRILHIDDILFKRPVELGSLLYLSSQVAYTEGKHIQISTKASVYDPIKAESNLTNIFHFTFDVDKPVKPCLPRSYDEAMLYIDGRRHYQLATGQRKYYGQSENQEDIEALE